MSHDSKSKYFKSYRQNEQENKSEDDNDEYMSFSANQFSEWNSPIKNNEIDQIFPNKTRK